MAMTILIPAGDDVVKEEHHVKGSCPSCKYSHEKSKNSEFYITNFAAFVTGDDGKQTLRPQCQIYGKYGDILKKAQADQTPLPIAKMERKFDRFDSIEPDDSWRTGGARKEWGGGGGGWKGGAGGNRPWTPQGYRGKQATWEEYLNAAEAAMGQGVSIMKACRDTFGLAVTDDVLLAEARAFMQRVMIGVTENVACLPGHKPGEVAAVESTQQAAPAEVAQPKAEVKLPASHATADEYIKEIIMATTQDEVVAVENRARNADLQDLPETMRTIIFKSAMSKKLELAKVGQ